MAYLILMLACRGGSAPTSEPEPTTPPVTADTSVPVDTSDPGTCLLAPQLGCNGGFFPVEGRVELRATSLTWTRPVCVACRTVQEGCDRLFGHCPDSKEGFLQLPDCSVHDEVSVGGRRLQRIRCVVPVTVNNQWTQAHEVFAYFDQETIVAVETFAVGYDVNEPVNYCCSEGGSARTVLWTEEPFWECGEAE